MPIFLHTLFDIVNTLQEVLECTRPLANAMLLLTKTKFTVAHIFDLTLLNWQNIEVTVVAIGDVSR